MRLKIKDYSNSYLLWLWNQFELDENEIFQNDIYFYVNDSVNDEGL